MKLKQFLCALTAAALLFTAAGCAAASQTAAVGTAPSEADYAAWAVEHGYVLNPEENGYYKIETDDISSATQIGMSGVNFGAIEWSDSLRTAALLEMLKGGRYLGDESFAQDDTGYNYREMYQLATCVNNVPSNTNLELVLDTKTLHLVGASESGTGKTIEFQKNPHVSLSWVRQLREEEEEEYNYYCSYGIQYNGDVLIYTTDDLKTEEGQNALLNLFDCYYPTLFPTWRGYSAAFAGLEDEKEIRAAKLAYITATMETGAMVYYEIIPDNIVITLPFLLNLSPEMPNAVKFTTVQTDGGQRYAYDLCLSESFLDKLVNFKADFISTEEGRVTVGSYYTGGIFPPLDAVCAELGVPTSLDYAYMTHSAAGLKTQTILRFNEEEN